MTQPNVRILVADKLSPEGIDLLRAEEGVEVIVHAVPPDDVFAQLASDVDAILVRSAAKVRAPILDAAKRLKVVGRAGIGVDNVDVKHATTRGVMVMNVPDANADTTAEHTISLLCALARNVPQADRSVREGRWERSKFIGAELNGKVFGIIGGGNIGRRVARRARGLGLEVVVHDPFLAKDALAELGIDVVTLEDLAAQADFISLHVPLIDATRNMVNSALIDKMKPGVRIINCARGGIVNEDDLVAALESGKVAGAALDVFATEPPPKDHPLLSRDDVVLTPHLGASTAEAQTRASVDLCRQVLDYLLRGEVRNAVNLPRVAKELMTELSPWIDLAGRLGRLLGGLLDAPCERIEVSYRGRLARVDAETVTRAAVAGVLSPAFEHPVNLINALDLAKSRGIAIEERRSEQIRDFTSMLTCRARCGGRSLTVAGTLFGIRQPRLVRIDRWHLEAILEGPILVVQNDDQPGVIGRLGSVLGDAAVNISAMHLSPPRAPGERALVVLNVTPDVPAATLERIRSLAGVSRAGIVVLPPR